MNRRLRILNVEDNPNDTEFIRAMLEQETILTDILRVDSREQFISALQQQHFDLILSDYNLPGFDGLSALQVAKQFAPDVPFIYVSGTIGEERAIEALKNGATDYVIKDRLKRLPAVVRRALAERQERTERRRTEEELRKLFRAIEQSPSMVMITDASGNIEYVNPKLTETTGYSAREIIGQNPRILKSGKMPDEEYQRLWKTITAGGEWHGELYNRRKTGENYWVSASISAVRNLDGVITHFVAVQEDITTRRQAEEKIHQQAALLDIDPDAIYVKDTEDRIQFWSKGAERLYGYTREEVLGQRSADLTFMEAPVEYNQALQAVLQHGHWKGEWQQRTRDGRDIVVSSSWLLVRDTQGLPQSIYVVNSDITEKKKLETQFLRAQRMESIGTLAGGIAH
ncbi:MAG: PAS domain S-box protein, partial [Bacteroidota bacterium]